MPKRHHTFIEANPSGAPDFGRTNPSQPKSPYPEADTVVLDTTKGEQALLLGAVGRAVAKSTGHISNVRASGILEDAAELAGIEPSRVVTRSHPGNNEIPVSRIQR